MKHDRPLPDALLRQREAAERFGLTHRRIRRWIERRRLPCWPAGAWRIDPAVMERAVHGPSLDEIEAVMAVMEGRRGARLPEGDQPTHRRISRIAARSCARAREMPSNEPPEFLTVREAEEYLAAKRTTLRRWTRLGYLHPTYLPGGGVRFRLDDLRALLRSGTQRPPRGRPFGTSADTPSADRGSNPLSTLAAGSEAHGVSTQSPAEPAE